MTLPALTARQRFTTEISKPDQDLDLARTALCVAQEEYPQLPVDVYLVRLDQIAEEVRGRLDNENAPIIVLQELLATLYESRGFKGNRDAYYDPRNSFLNDVLDRRMGIPLTLGIVVLEVGWRLGLPLEGVNFPHHFLVRFNGDALRLLIDPYDGGELSFEDDSQALLDRVYGGMVRIQDSFLKAASKRDMLVRLLTNLKALYLNARDDSRAIAAVERILLLQPDAPVEHRTLGLLLSRTERRAEAAEHLRRYLDSDPGTADAMRIQGFLERIETGEAPDVDEELKS